MNQTERRALATKLLNAAERVMYEGEDVDTRGLGKRRPGEIQGTPYELLKPGQSALRSND